MKTALVHHPIYKKHNTGPGHPETPMRYTAVMDALKEDDAFWSSLKEITPEKASKGLVLAAHTAQHFKRVEGAVENGLDRLDADTTISMQSFDAALFAAGGAVAGVDAVMQGEAKNAFVAVRPPGHHATAENSMGFCLFNNVAVAAKYAQNNYKEIERVAIIDWDVHHGNGTQHTFEDDPSVLYISTHQYPFYPGTGAWYEDGVGRGKGATLNCPMTAGSGNHDYEQAFMDRILPRINAFRPQFVILSAGFDAHRDDPLAQIELSTAFYGWMTERMLEAADQHAGGRIVSVLEGGYNLQRLPECVAVHMQGLGGFGATPP